MRSLRRLAVAPPTLKPAGPGGRKAADHRSARIADPSAPLTFPSHWNNADVRGVLYATQWRVCAYCGRHLPGNDRGDVEHYRPKKKVAEAPLHGGYWWLGYDLSNYLLSCGVCNSSRKGNKFPVRPRARHYSYARRRQLEREGRLLWDPAVDPLDDWVTVDWNDPLIRVTPSAGLSTTQRLQVQQSIEFFRINRDRFLWAERLEVLDRVTQAIEDGDDAVAGALAVRYSPQSLVARAFIRDRDPGLLPDPAVELAWLLDRVLTELDQLLALRERFPDDERTQLELDETYWCLAALLRDPVDGEPARIERVCRAHGVLDEVRTRSAEL